MYFFCLFLICLFPLFGHVQLICPKQSLLVEEIEIAVEGLEAGQEIYIELMTLEGRYVQWVGKGKFIAREDGTVRLSRDAPTAGTYEGVDSMGLFWSMQEQNVLWYEAIAEEKEWFGPFWPMQLKVYSKNGELLANQMIERRFEREGIEEIDVQEDGLIGTLFLPEGRERQPVVIVLTGSNGGVPETTGAMLAAQGIPAFALAYTGVGHLPPTVEDVHLEYFETAFQWVKNHPRLNGRIALHGTSRGAELALLLGSMFPDQIERIVAKAPSCVVLSSDSWFYCGNPVLPAAPYFIDLNNDGYYGYWTRENPRTIRKHRERGLYLERDLFDAAMIPVEKITCPILLISGGDDQLGPCTEYAKLILQRLEESGSNIPRFHLDYPFAGHLIDFPYLPRHSVYFDGIKEWWLYGGTPYHNEMASRDSWKKLVAFLKEWIDK